MEQSNTLAALFSYPKIFLPKLVLPQPQESQATTIRIIFLSTIFLSLSFRRRHPNEIILSALPKETGRKILLVGKWIDGDLVLGFLANGLYHRSLGQSRFAAPPQDK